MYSKLTDEEVDDLRAYVPRPVLYKVSVHTAQDGVIILHVYPVSFWPQHNFFIDRPSSRLGVVVRNATGVCVVCQHVLATQRLRCRSGRSESL
jgi:hypothetical protein